MAHAGGGGAADADDAISDLEEKQAARLNAAVGDSRRRLLSRRLAAQSADCGGTAEAAAGTRPRVGGRDADANNDATPHSYRPSVSR